VAQYAGNPVIPNPGIKDFRDPKVIWHPPSGRWVMAVSADKRIRFYSSPNLLDWTFESEFGEGQGSHAAVWECPDLFQLPVDGDQDVSKWVLHVSIGDNEETDGSTAQYFVGQFDGKRFVNDRPGDQVAWTDHGQDFYAAVTYSDISEEDGRRIWLGWLSNWKYPFGAPTKPWKGGLTIARELTLRTGENGEILLVQQPVKELERLREQAYAWHDLKLTDETLSLGFHGIAYEFETVIEWEDSMEFGLRLRVSKSGTEVTTVGYSVKSDELFVDRSRSGFGSLNARENGIVNIGKRFVAPRSRTDKQIRLRGFVDASSLELFAEDGERVFTIIHFPEPASDGLELYAAGGAAIFTQLHIYALKTIWRMP
jgi:fructan beta-fructosidase